MNWVSRFSSLFSTLYSSSLLPCQFFPPGKICPCVHTHLFISPAPLVWNGTCRFLSILNDDGFLLLLFPPQVKSGSTYKRKKKLILISCSAKCCTLCLVYLDFGVRLKVCYHLIRTHPWLWFHVKSFSEMAGVHKKMPIDQEPCKTVYSIYKHFSLTSSLALNRLSRLGVCSFPRVWIILTK